MGALTVPLDLYDRFRLLKDIGSEIMRTQRRGALLSEPSIYPR